MNRLEALNKELGQLDRNNLPVKEPPHNGVPSKLVDAVIHQESRGNSSAVSPKGAVGKMQLMRDTAIEMGLRVDDQVDERLDPVKNVEAGTKYLQAQYKKYGNWQDALAAYNWGPGNVDKWIASGRDINHLPDETKNYVTTLSNFIDPTRLEKLNKDLYHTFGNAPSSLEGLATENPNRGVTNVDWVDEGALNSGLTDAWNNFKQGIDQTQQMTSFGKADDYQKVIDEAPNKKAELETQFKLGKMSESDYQNSISGLNQEVASAQRKVQEYDRDFNSNSQEIKNEPVSRKYQTQNWLTQAQGSQASTWDKLAYTAPGLVGSSAALMGSQLLATFGSEAAKKLLAAGFLAVLPEATATKAAAFTALSSAIGLMTWSRSQESFSEVGGAIQQNQQTLLQQWQNSHFGQEPTPEDLRQIRIQARKGSDSLYWQNMALSIPDAVEALIMPGSKLGDVFTSLNKPLRYLGKTIEDVRDFNKVSRLGSTLTRGYLNYLGEKFEEGFQYAAQKRQQDQALDTGLYDNQGFFKNLITDAHDVIGSLNYSPIGVIRNSDGRYSNDPEFQFSEEAGGLLSILPAGIATTRSIVKDVNTYRKVSKVLSNNPFTDPEDKLFRLKSEIYQSAFSNDSVHHLIEGIKGLTKQKDVNGNPLLTEEDANKEISNIKTAYHKYEAVDSYINSLGGFFDSKELKEAKAYMKFNLFHTSLDRVRTDTELKDLRDQKAKILGQHILDPKVTLEDLQHQLAVRVITLHNIGLDRKTNPDTATIYEFDLKENVLKDQIKEITDKIEAVKKDNNLKDEDFSENFPDEILNVNMDLLRPEINDKILKDRYLELKKIKNPTQAKEWLAKTKALIEAKKKAFDNIENQKTKAEADEKAKTAQEKADVEKAKSDEERDTETILQKMITREGNASNIQEVTNKVKATVNNVSNQIFDKKQTLGFLENLLDEHLNNINASQESLKKKIETYLTKKEAEGKPVRASHLGKMLTEFHDSFNLANDIQNRITELDSELKQLEELHKDLSQKLSYYNNLINDSNFASLDLTELKDKRNKIQKKLNKLQQAVEQVRKFISQTVDFLKYLTGLITKNFENLEDHRKKYRFKSSQFKTEADQLKDLLKRQKEGTLDKTSELLLINYPAIKAEYEALEAELLPLLDYADFQESLEKDYKADLENLNDKIVKYQQQMRFLDDLIADLTSSSKNEPIVKKAERPITPQAPKTNEPTFTGTLSKDTVQKIGTNIEYPIISSGEHVDEDGFRYFEVLKPDGTIEKVSQKEAWYKSNDTNAVKRDAKEHLNGIDHFNNILKYNLSKERDVLNSVRQASTRKGEPKSNEQILRENPNAFPAHKALAILHKVLSRPDWQDHIKLVLDTKFVEKNKTQDTLVFESSTGLRGLRNTGVDILMEVTDPETGESTDLFHPLNPDFYGFEAPDKSIKLFDLDTLDFDSFTKYFDMKVFIEGTHQANRAIDKKEFAALKQSWKNLRDFKLAVELWHSQNPDVKELPKDFYTPVFKATFDHISDNKKPYISMQDSPSTKDAPIYFRDPAVVNSGWVTTKQDPDLPLSKLPSNMTGYFAAATLPNGEKIWVKLTPAKVVSIDERLTLIGPSLNDVVKKLSELDPEDPKSFDRAKSIIKDLKFFIAGQGSQQIDPLIKTNKDGTFNLAYNVSSTQVDDDGTEKTVYAGTVYINTFSKKGEVRTYTFDQLVEKINEKGQEINVQVSGDNFRHNIPLSKTTENQATIHKAFNITVNPGIVKNPTVKFNFNAARPLAQSKPAKVSTPAPAFNDPFGTNTTPEDIFGADPKTINNPPASVPTADIFGNTPGTKTSMPTPEEIEEIMRAQGADEGDIKTAVKVQEEAKPFADPFGITNPTEEDLRQDDDSEFKKRLDDEEERRNSAFKVARTSNITEPITLEEAKKYLAKMLPEGFTLEDLDNLYKNTAKNGVLVGAVINKTMYLRDVSDKSDLYHETFHAVFRNLLSNDRSRAYLNKAKSEMNLTPEQLKQEIEKLRAQETYNDFTEQELEDQVYEEYLADKFFDWKKDQGPIKSWLRQLFTKIWNFIKFAFSSNIDALYYKIENQGFQNSQILSTRYNAQGSFNTAYKILRGANNILSEEILYSMAAKIIDGVEANIGVDNVKSNRFQQALNYFIEYYNPKSPENQKIIAGDKKVEAQFKFRQEIYKHPINQELLFEQLSHFFDSINLNSQDLLVNETEDDTLEAQYGLGDAYQDPFNRTGRKIKSIIATTSYDSLDSFGKPFKQTLDPRTFYSRLLPILSISNTAPEQMMPKLAAMADYDVQIAAFYKRMSELTGYNEVENSIPNEASKVQIFKAFQKAFEVEQLPFWDLVFNHTNGIASPRLFEMNKVDLGKANLTTWINHWTNNTENLLQSGTNQNTLFKRLETITLNIKENKGDRIQDIKELQKILHALGITLQDAYLHYSFGVNESSEKLRNAFEGVTPMTVTDLGYLGKIIVTKSNPFNRGSKTNTNYYDRLLILADANANFDPSLVLKTYQDSNGKTRYSYVYSNNILRKTREYNLMSLSEVQALRKANNGYFSYNPLISDDKNAVENLSNLGIGLTANIRVGSDETNASDEVKEKISKGATIKDLDSDSQLAMMHMLFLDQKKSGKTEGVAIAKYWLTQIADKSTQYAASLPVSNFWNEDGFTDLAKEKLFNLVKQEYLRNQGKFQAYIKRDSFLLFPFLSPKYLESANIELEKENIISDISTAFKGLVKKHKEELDSLGYVINDKLSFLPEGTFSKEQYGSLDNYLGNFITNQFIYTTGALQLLTGDIAWASSWADFIKRMGGAIASGPTLGDQDIIVLHATGVINRIDPDTLDKSKDENHPDLKADDAQVISTVYTKMHILRELGELTPAAESGLNKVMKQIEPKLTSAEKRAVDLISAKLVGYGFDKDGNLQYNKQSTWFLTKGFTTMLDKEGNEVPRPGREYHHNLRVSLEKISDNKQPILFSPKTANKLYKASNPIDNSHFLTKTLDKVSSDAMTLMPGNTFRKQQENDSKTKDKMVLMRQLVDIIGSEVKDPEMRKLLDSFRKDLATIRNLAFEDAKNLLVNQNANGTYSRGDLTAWLSAVQENLMDSGSDSQLIEFMNGDYDFNLPHVESKIKELFLSTFKEAFQKKISGRKCTLLSAANFEVPVDKFGRVITQEDIEKGVKPAKTRPLNIHKLVDGKIQEAEVLMTRKTAEMRGINISDPSKDDYMKIVGVRIPLQSYHSTIVGRIVDFLPDEYGDSIIAPEQVVYLGGMDYDVDALYVFLNNFFINKEGKTVKFGEESSDQERYEGYRKYLLKNNRNVNKEVNRILVNDPDYRVLNPNKYYDDDLTGASEENFMLSLMSEVAPKAVQAKIDEIKEKALDQALAKYKFPNTLESFIESKTESEGLIQNRMLDNMHNILRAPELAKAYKTPASNTSTKASIAYLEKIKALDPMRKEGVIPNTPVSVGAAFKAALQGKGNTGTAVNANTSTAAFCENGFGLVNKFTINGQTFQDGGFESSAELQREKADTGSTMLTAAVDNGNDPVADDLNLDGNTIPERAVLVALGVKDIKELEQNQKETLDLEFISSFFAQPAIKQVLINVAKSVRLVLPTDKTSASQAATKLGLKYGSFISNVESYANTLGNKELIDHIKSEKYRNDVNKELLEISFTVPKIAINHDSLSKLTPEDIKLIYTALINQKVVLDKYIELDEIARHMGLWSSVGSLNRQLTSDMKVLSRPIENFKELTAQETAVISGIREAVVNNQNLKDNLKNLHELVQISKAFFLSETKLFSDFYEGIKSILDPKTVLQSPNKYEETMRDIKKNLLSFLTIKMLKHRQKVSFDGSYGLLFPSKGTTLAREFFNLLKTDENGVPLKPEFANNQFVKALKANAANTKENPLSFEILAADSRTKFSPKTNRTFVDAIESLWVSDDPEIRAFANNMFKYAIVKDGLQFTDKSFVKYIPAPFFKNIAKDLEKLNKAVAYQVIPEDINNLFGTSMGSLLREFVEIYGRDKMNSRSIIDIKNGFMDLESGDMPVTNTMGKNENGVSINTIKRGKNENGNVMISQVITDPIVLLNSIFKGHLNKDFSIKFPFIMKYNRILMIKVKETLNNQGKTEAEYKPLTKFGVTGMSSYVSSIKTNEDMYRLAKIINKTPKKETSEIISNSQENVVSSQTDNSVRSYEGNIKSEPNTVFVFGSNPEGRHGKGAALIATQQFGAKYGQGEGLQGNAYALPTKDLKITTNNGYKSISAKEITSSIKKLYEIARQNPNKDFKVAYRNTDKISLNGYTGLEMIDMFKAAGSIPSNIIFSKEWVDTGKFNSSNKEAKTSWETHGEALTKKYGAEIKDAWANFTQEEKDYKIKCL